LVATATDRDSFFFALSRPGIIYDVVIAAVAAGFALWLRAWFGRRLLLGHGLGLWRWLWRWCGSRRNSRRTSGWRRWRGRRRRQRQRHRRKRRRSGDESISWGRGQLLLTNRSSPRWGWRRGCCELGCRADGEQIIRKENRGFRRCRRPDDAERRRPNERQRPN
jgi:hypothetical protein